MADVRAFKPKGIGYQKAVLYVAPFLLVLRLFVRVNRENWAVASVAGFTLLILLLVAFRRRIFAGEPREIGIAEGQIRVRVLFDNHSYGCGDVKRVHSELFGATTMTVNRDGKERVYSFALHGRDVEAFRIALRQACPGIKVTGLPTETIIASERH
jgi:hypothetical protein